MLQGLLSEQPSSSQMITYPTDPQLPPVTSPPQSHVALQETPSSFVLGY